MSRTSNIYRLGVKELWSLIREREHGTVEHLPVMLVTVFSLTFVIALIHFRKTIGSMA